MLNQYKKQWQKAVVIYILKDDVLSYLTVLISFKSTFDHRDRIYGNLKTKQKT